MFFFNKKRQNYQVNGNTLSFFLISGIFLFLCGVVLALSFLKVFSGLMFSMVNSFFYGLFGSCTPAIPVLLLWLGILMLRKTKYPTKIRYFLFALCFLLLLSAILNSTGIVGETNFLNYLENLNQEEGIANKAGFKEMFDRANIICKKLYQNNSQTFGGAFGILCSHSFWYYLGHVTASALLIAITVLLFAVIFLTSVNRPRKTDTDQNTVNTDFVQKQSYPPKNSGLQSLYSKKADFNQTPMPDTACSKNQICFDPAAMQLSPPSQPDYSSLFSSQPVISSIPIATTQYGYQTDPNVPGSVQPVILIPNGQQPCASAFTSSNIPQFQSVQSNDTNTPPGGPDLSYYQEQLNIEMPMVSQSEEIQKDREKMRISSEKLLDRISGGRKKKRKMQEELTVSDESDSNTEESISSFFAEPSKEKNKTENETNEDFYNENISADRSLPVMSFAPQVLQYQAFEPQTVHTQEVILPQTETIPEGSESVSHSENSIEKFQTLAAENEIPLHSIQNVPEIPSIQSENARIEPVSDKSNEQCGGEQYIKPPLDLLRSPSPNQIFNIAEDEERARGLEAMFKGFNIHVEVKHITHGPSVSRYEIALLKNDVNISRISSLIKNIEMELQTTGAVQIEEHISGTNLFGVYVPNAKRQSVTLREILESDTMRNEKSPTAVALGHDINGKPVICDISKMPHLLVAGTTGSGKSVCMNGMITSILYRTSPAEVRLILIDPKMVEFAMYEAIPHLLIPVVSDSHKASGALMWAVGEMEDRYQRFKLAHVKDLISYNASIQEDQEPMPRILIFIDELADLMMTCQKDVEDSIVRLAQKARAAGIHMVLATQRPEAKIVTGLIRGNINSRISLKVANATDSTIALGYSAAGAEKLLGNGDMLYKYVGDPIRLQGCYISEKESRDIMNFIQAHNKTDFDQNAIDGMEAAASGGEEDKSDTAERHDDLDRKIEDAIELVLNSGQASASMLQRVMGVGYPRAGKMIDQMERLGIISCASGPGGKKAREVIMSREEYEMNKDYLLGRKELV